MKDKIIFVSNLCPDCTELIKDFDENPEKYKDYDFINITESMMNLKTYLSYRDHLVDFDKIKRDGKVGVPSMVEDGRLKLL